MVLRYCSYDLSSVPGGPMPKSSSACSAGTMADCAAHHTPANSGGASIATIIRLRRLYFMGHGLGGFGTGAEEVDG